MNRNQSQTKGCGRDHQYITVQPEEPQNPRGGLLWKKERKSAVCEKKKEEEGWGRHDMMGAKSLLSTLMLLQLQLNSYL